MNCAACGGDNREGARFCRHCGVSFVQEIEIEPVSAEPAAVAEPPVVTQAEIEEATATDLAPEVGPETASESTTADQPAGGAAGEPAIGPAEPALPPAEAPEAAPAEMATGPAPASNGEQEAAPLLPVEPGNVIAGRYVLIEAVEARRDEILYRARDLQRCWQCGYDGNGPDDAFCAQCGAALGRKPEVRLLQVRETTAEPSGGKGGFETRPYSTRVDEQGRTFLVLTEPVGSADQGRPQARGIRLAVGYLSDVGAVRELNEDSVFTLQCSPCYESRTAPALGLFAVADGMGGHEGGEVASKLALQVLARELVTAALLPELSGAAAPEEALLARVQGAVVAANDAVFLERQKRENDMGTTLTVILVRDDRLFLGHVGDSRAYRWNAEGMVQLTADHSMVASLVASGRAKPEEIYTHPQRSVIVRCIGDRPLVDVDTATLPLEPGDCLVLCSDGLWEMIRTEGMADVLMQEADPQLACELLVKRANQAGGEDNITAVVVKVVEA